MPEIKLWGAMHVDETEARQFVQSAIDDPIPNVDAELADTANLGPGGSRSELCCALPGNSHSDAYLRLPDHLKARGIEVVAASVGYYATADMHNVTSFGDNYACISRERGVSPTVLGMLAELGIRNIVDTGDHGIPGSVPNGFVLETVSSGLGRNHERLREVFRALANNSNPRRAAVTDFRWFKIVYGLHVSKVHPDDLSQEVRDSLRAFEPFPPDIAARLGHEGVLCPTSWRFRPRANGFWGEFGRLTTEPTPSEQQHWPQ